MFPVHTHQLHKGDRLFLFTDGYSDQFGGSRNKKLQLRPFVNVLLDLSRPDITGHSTGASELVTTLEQHFSMWMGDHEQVDDVLVLVLNVG